MKNAILTSAVILALGGAAQAESLTEKSGANATLVVNGRPCGHGARHEDYIRKNRLGPRWL